MYFVKPGSQPIGSKDVCLRSRRCPFLRWHHHHWDLMDSDSSSLKRPYPDSPTEGPPRPRRARPKTSKACNACRKQKSRCERLAGDLQGCHRCEVIGISCVFQTEPSPTEPGRDKKPRPLLPRSSAAHNSSSSSNLQKQANGRDDRQE